LTTIQPWFTLEPRDREKVFGWIGEAFREAAVLIVIFIVAEKSLSFSITLSLAWKFFCISVVIYCIGLKFGLIGPE
jgi:hypothetical protein